MKRPIDAVIAQGSDKPFAKPWWRSRTNWFNATTAILAGVNELMPILAQLAVMGWSSDLVAQVRGILVLVNIVGNLILRRLTTGPVSWK